MADKPLTEWSAGLIDCFEDASTCCYGFWCPCFLACTVSGRFGENSLLPLCDFLFPTAACGMPLSIPPAALSMRVAMRHQYGIKGSLCKDIMVSCCCPLCSWCQMHRELKERMKTPTIINVQSQTIVGAQPAPVAMMQAQPAQMYPSNQQGFIVTS